ncbi:MFS transporter [Arsenicicoccus piscis]|uniref:MFS transporter n=1 Tax=Arsenicicoccus piscis TaxID=673954 RepID=A0ABQ6HT19_9MICO|nr:MFS transporter [Arsenicicoccus piscis]GMA20973.1 hypothetical protein GCM10025862_29940 [Arsenicicoccus piscis]
MALVLGAIVANRWFYAHRGLVTGLFSGANATGQLLFLPAIAAAVAGPGWRYAAMIVAVLALVVALLVGLFLRDYPHQVGLMPFGVGEGQAIDAAPPCATRRSGPTALMVWIPSLVRRPTRGWWPCRRCAGRAAPGPSGRWR